MKRVKTVQSVLLSLPFGCIEQWAVKKKSATMKGGYMKVGTTSGTNGSKYTVPGSSLICHAQTALKSKISLLMQTLMKFICQMKQVKSSKLDSPYELHILTKALFVVLSKLPTACRDLNFPKRASRTAM